MTASFDTGIAAPHASAPPFESARCDFPSRELGKGDTLYHAGDPADTIYRVDEGLLKLSVDLLTGKERIINIAGPGDFIGAITPTPLLYGEHAEALSPHVRVRVIARDELDARLKDAVHTAAGEHLARLREALEDSELPVPARIARTFLRLGQRFGHVSHDHVVRLTLPLTHENFAAMVGAARETTTTLLSEMREDGIIQGTRGRYTFNEHDLNEYALSNSF
jgi:CRP/FNR family cyclic AMP-dependent transcriptional regulator